ncbi:uncharacterized protein BYT42DRAFT_336600 [Radiomyces spectabilis]|uniref:uncharacterized protein n=1 Tax=Radiomyces spectabilis TaxID=64574 RepID=UPI002220AFFA|nr:uncharacterized protein BYT42DRAFT_336600 [Radiomyces spectabilis]KAI8379676.1 hypothetical protein BYT42DRAFT_336600 [Radiomyces spectabilis]
MASNTNLSVILQKPGEIVIENRPIPEIGPYDALVNVKVTGICGSDVHYWTKGRIGSFVVEKPMVLGHESAGVVAAVGDKVTHLKVGDRVALEPGVPCRVCDQCKHGRYNLCPEMIFAATPPYDGTLCNYYRHAADFCFKLPENVSLEEGALIEPLSVGVHAVRRGKVQAGDRVAIFGAGAVGLLAAAAAKAAGAGHVTIADIVASRLDFAKTYCTDSQVLLEKTDPNEPNIDYSKRMANKILESHELADVVIDCSGAETSVQTAIYITRNGGSVVLVGMGAPVQSIPVSEIGIREVDIKGVFRYCNTYPRAVKMIASGTIDVKPLITHSYKLEESVEAFKHVKEGRDGTIKVQIHG